MQPDGANAAAAATLRDIVDKMRQATKARERSDAIARLKNILGNVSLARSVDAETVRTRFKTRRKQEKERLVTWPVVLHATIKCVREEQESTRASLKKDFAAAVLCVVRTADHAARTGGRRMLEPCALPLFRHVLEMLKAVQGATADAKNVEAEYRTLLQRLLDAPPYCNCAVDEGDAVADEKQPFAELTALHVDMLKDDVAIAAATEASAVGGAANARASALTKRAHTLGALIRRFPTDLPPSLGVSLVAFFVDAVKRAPAIEGPMGAALVGALNNLLVRLGPDVSAAAARRLHEALAPRLHGAWAKTTSVQTRDQIGRYFRIHLHLAEVFGRGEDGAGDDDDDDDDDDDADGVGLARLRHVVGVELEALAAALKPRDSRAFAAMPMRTIGVGSTDTRRNGVVPRNEVGLTMLAADVAVRCRRTSENPHAHAAAKRPRMGTSPSPAPSFAASPCALGARCAAFPSIYVPVLCCALRHPLRNDLLDGQGLSELLNALAGALPGALALGADVEARAAVGTQLWMLRGVLHLAVAHGNRRENDGTSSKLWLHIYRTILDALPLYARKQRITREALDTLACISACGLVDAHDAGAISPAALRVAMPDEVNGGELGPELVEPLMDTQVVHANPVAPWRDDAASVAARLRFLAYCVARQPHLSVEARRNAMSWVAEAMNTGGRGMRTSASCAAERALGLALAALAGFDRVGVTDNDGTGSRTGVFQGLPFGPWLDDDIPNTRSTCHARRDIDDMLVPLWDDPDAAIAYGEEDVRYQYGRNARDALKGVSCDGIGWGAMPLIDESRAGATRGEAAATWLDHTPISACALLREERSSLLNGAARACDSLLNETLNGIAALPLEVCLWRYVTFMRVSMLRLSDGVLHGWSHHNSSLGSSPNEYINAIRAKHRTFAERFGKALARLDGVTPRITGSDLFVPAAAAQAAAAAAAPSADMTEMRDAARAASLLLSRCRAYVVGFGSTTASPSDEEKSPPAVHRTPPLHCREGIADFVAEASSEWADHFARGLKSAFRTALGACSRGGLNATRDAEEDVFDDSVSADDAPANQRVQRARRACVAIAQMASSIVYADGGVATIKALCSWVSGGFDERTDEAVDTPEDLRMEARAFMKPSGMESEQNPAPGDMDPAVLDELVFQLARSLLTIVARFGFDGVGNLQNALASIAYVCFAHSSLPGERRFGGALRSAAVSLRAVLLVLQQRARRRALGCLDDADGPGKPLSAAFFGLLELIARVRDVRCRSIMARAPLLELHALVTMQALWINTAEQTRDAVHATATMQSDGDHIKRPFLDLFDTIIEGLGDVNHDVRMLSAVHASQLMRCAEAWHAANVKAPLTSGGIRPSESDAWDDNCGHSEEVRRLATLMVGFTSGNAAVSAEELFDACKDRLDATSLQERGAASTSQDAGGRGAEAHRRSSLGLSQRATDDIRAYMRMSGGDGQEANLLKEKVDAALEASRTATRVYCLSLVATHSLPLERETLPLIAFAAADRGANLLILARSAYDSVASSQSGIREGAYSLAEDRALDIAYLFVLERRSFSDVACLRQLFGDTGEDAALFCRRWANRLLPWYWIKREELLRQYMDEMRGDLRAEISVLADAVDRNIVACLEALRAPTDTSQPRDFGLAYLRETHWRVFAPLLAAFFGYTNHAPRLRDAKRDEAQYAMGLKPAPERIASAPASHTWIPGDTNGLRQTLAYAYGGRGESEVLLEHIVEHVRKHACDIMVNLFQLVECSPGARAASPRISRDHLVRSAWHFHTLMAREGQGPTSPLRDARALFAIVCRLTAYVDAACGDRHVEERFACVEALLEAVTNPQDGMSDASLADREPAYLPPGVARILVHGIARTALRCSALLRRACVAMKEAIAAARLHLNVDESERLALGDTCHAVVVVCCLSAEQDAQMVLAELIRALVPLPDKKLRDQGIAALRASFPLPCRVRVEAQSRGNLAVHACAEEPHYPSVAKVLELLKQAGAPPPGWDAQVQLLAWRRMRRYDASRAHDIPTSSVRAIQARASARFAEGGPALTGFGADFVVDSLAALERSGAEISASALRREARDLLSVAELTGDMSLRSLAGELLVRAGPSNDPHEAMLSLDGARARGDAYGRENSGTHVEARRVLLAVATSGACADALGNSEAAAEEITRRTNTLPYMTVFDSPQSMLASGSRKHKVHPLMNLSTGLGKGPTALLECILFDALDVAVRCLCDNLGRAWWDVGGGVHGAGGEMGAQLAGCVCSALLTIFAHPVGREVKNTEHLRRAIAASLSALRAGGLEDFAWSGAFEDAMARAQGSDVAGMIPPPPPHAASLWRIARKDAHRFVRAFCSSLCFHSACAPLQALWPIALRDGNLARRLAPHVLLYCAVQAGPENYYHSVDADGQPSQALDGTPMPNGELASAMEWESGDYPASNARPSTHFDGLELSKVLQDELLARVLDANAFESSASWRAAQACTANLMRWIDFLRTQHVLSLRATASRTVATEILTPRHWPKPWYFDVPAEAIAAAGLAIGFDASCMFWCEYAIRADSDPRLSAGTPASTSSNPSGISPTGCPLSWHPSRACGVSKIDNLLLVACGRSTKLASDGLHAVAAGADPVAGAAVDASAGRWGGVIATLAPAPGELARAARGANVHEARGAELQDALRELGVVRGASLSDKAQSTDVALAETQRAVALACGLWPADPCAGIADVVGGDGRFHDAIDSGVACLTSDDATAFKACASRASACAFDARADTSLLAIESVGVLDLLGQRLCAVTCLEAAAAARWDHPEPPPGKDGDSWRHPSPRVAWLLARWDALAPHASLFGDDGDAVEEAAIPRRGTLGPQHTTVIQAARDVVRGVQLSVLRAQPLCSSHSNAKAVLPVFLIAAARECRQVGRLGVASAHMKELRGVARAWQEEVHRDPSGAEHAKEALRHLVETGDYVVWQREETDLLWALGRHTMSREAHQYLAFHANDGDSHPLVKADVLRSYAGRLIACDQDSSEIMAELFEHALRAAKAAEPPPARAGSAKAQGQQLVNFLERFGESGSVGSGSQSLVPPALCHNHHRARVLCQTHYSYAEWCFLQMQSRLDYQSRDGKEKEELRKRRSTDLDKLEALFTTKHREYKDLGKGRGENDFATLQRRYKYTLKDLNEKIHNLRTEIRDDKEAEATSARMMETYRRLATKHYQRCLQQGDWNNVLGVHRLSSLWFRYPKDRYVCSMTVYGCDPPADSDVMPAGACGKTFVGQLSHKWIVVVNQIASRLQPVDKGPADEALYRQSLMDAMARLCVCHPHHALYDLMCVWHGSYGCDGADTKEGDGKGPLGVNYDRVAAARSCLEMVRAAPQASERTPRMREVVEQYDKVCSVYIRLGAHDVPKEDIECGKLRFEIPRAVSKVKELACVPIPTLRVQVSRDAEYPPDSYRSFMCVRDASILPNSQNKPKKVVVEDNYGGCWTQCLKSVTFTVGSDDMRQDACMIRFFGLANALLARDPACRARGLEMATYKVIPFSPFAGVVEWVSGTVELRSCIYGSHGRHAATGDYAENKSRTRMRAAHDDHGKVTKAFSKGETSKAELAQSQASVRGIFDEVCKHHRPCLHHFFLETHATPAAWIVGVSTFRRSIAASSIVGYAVGLGDRHLSNILVKNATSEVVHIDLGIAFEQGRTLALPEKVPFRLTREVVDGLGSAGVEGAFRRACVETLRVLREHRGPLMSTLEVFLHDPQYKWGLSATQRKAENRKRTRGPEEDGGDDGSDDDGGGGGGGGGAAAAAAAAGEGEGQEEEEDALTDARSALLKVGEKLVGLCDDGLHRGIEGQAAYLISDAMDAGKLAFMFSGWCPWA